MFKLHSTDDGRVPAIEYLPCSDITPKLGIAMVLSGGKLAVASATTKPTYICMCEKENACTAGDIIPVMRVLPDMVLETTVSAAATAIKLGDKVTISTDGSQVTATTTSGIAEIVYMDGTAAGSMCRVRFN